MWYLIRKWRHGVFSFIGKFSLSRWHEVNAASVSMVDYEYSSILCVGTIIFCLWLCWCSANSFFFLCWILPLALKRIESRYRIHHVSKCIPFILGRFKILFEMWCFFFFVAELLWINGTFFLAPRQIIWILDSAVHSEPNNKTKFILWTWCVHNDISASSFIASCPQKTRRMVNFMLLFVSVWYLTSTIAVEFNLLDAECLFVCFSSVYFWLWFIVN